MKETDSRESLSAEASVRSPFDGDFVTPEEVAFVKRKWLAARARLGELGNRVAVAERSARDLAADRDQWKARALAAEALILSLGFGKKTGDRVIA